MSYFTTSQVNVFPSTYRQQIPNGKFTSEKNFVNILNSFIDYKSDQDGYVLSYDNGLLKVVIHGYYFEISDFDTTAYRNVWLSILVEKGGNSLINYSDRSINLDDAGGNGEFKGLSLDSGVAPTPIVEDDYDWYTLQIMADGNIINRARLSTDSIRYRAETKTATEKLDEKQDKLIPSAPIKISEKSEISFDDTAYVKFGDVKNVGADNNPIYFNNKGEATASKANIGSNYEKENNAVKSQSIIMDNGLLQGGQTIWASTNSPNNTQGNDGDFWFKYNI